MKKILSKMKALEFPHYNQSSYPIWPKTCKNEDPIKNEGARVLTMLYFGGGGGGGGVSRRSRAANSAVRGRILPKFEFIQAFLVVLVTCKNFFRHSNAATCNSAVLGRIRPNFELFRDIIVVLRTCKNEEDPIKNEGARVLTIFSPL